MQLDSNLLNLITHPSVKTLSYLVIFLAGLVIPVLIGIILPRRRTIGYGRIIYKLFGTCLAQTRIQEVSGSILQSIMTVIRSTFVDLSFGIYIESRSDLSDKDKEKKIQEYIDLTLNKTPEP